MVKIHKFKRIARRIKRTKQIKRTKRIIKSIDKQKNVINYELLRVQELKNPPKILGITGTGIDILIDGKQYHINNTFYFDELKKLLQKFSTPKLDLIRSRRITNNVVDNFNDNIARVHPQVIDHIFENPSYNSNIKIEEVN